MISVCFQSSKLKIGGVPVRRLFTVIAAAGFAHVVEGAVEMTAIAPEGRFSALEAMRGFIAPALIGYIIGGSVLFTLIDGGQIWDELEH